MEDKGKVNILRVIVRLNETMSGHCRARTHRRVMNINQSHSDGLSTSYLCSLPGLACNFPDHFDPRIKGCGEWFELAAREGIKGSSIDQGDEHGGTLAFIRKLLNCLSLLSATM